MPRSDPPFIGQPHATWLTSEIIPASATTVRAGLPLPDQSFGEETLQ
jgi:hypothetical protein